MDNDGMAVRVWIRGRVQGVGYRDWTRRRAAALGLAGWVRNRRDGAVEALFVGPAAVVERMLADCRQGPSLARVDTLDTEPAPVASYDGFSFRPTE